MKPPSTGSSERFNGIEMYYETWGEGKPLLFLHGFTGSGADWRHVFKAPLPGFKLIAPDLRSHGRSTGSDGVFTFRQCSLDLFALLDRLGVDQFCSVGLSGGGQALLHMATQQPRRVEAMVLVSTAHYFPEPARQIMRQMTLESRTEEDWRVMRQRHKHGDDQIRGLWRQANAFKDSFDDVNFTPAYLSTITARTLIVHGDRDPLYPVGISVEIYRAIPRSYLWIVPNGGHGPIFGDMAQPFLDAVSAFLESRWER